MNFNCGVFMLHVLVILQEFRLCEGSSEAFQHFRTPRTFAAAEADCVARGGNLASIHSSNENFEAEDDISGSDKDAWIGLQEVNGNFRWTDGSAFDFQSFGSQGGQPCFYLDKDFDAQWFDSSCNTPRNYICLLAGNNQGVLGNLGENKGLAVGGIVGGVIAVLVAGAFFFKYRSRSDQQQYVMDGKIPPHVNVDVREYGYTPHFNSNMSYKSTASSSTMPTEYFGSPAPTTHVTGPPRPPTGVGRQLSKLNVSNVFSTVPKSTQIKSNQPYEVQSYHGPVNKNMKRGAISTLLLPFRRKT